MSSILVDILWVCWRQCSRIGHTHQLLFWLTDCRSGADALLWQPRGVPSPPEMAVVAAACNCDNQGACDTSVGVGWQPEIMKTDASHFIRKRLNPKRGIGGGRKRRFKASFPLWSALRSFDGGSELYPDFSLCFGCYFFAEISETVTEAICWSLDRFCRILSFLGTSLALCWKFFVWRKFAVGEACKAWDWTDWTIKRQNNQCLMSCLGIKKPPWDLGIWAKNTHTTSLKGRGEHFSERGGETETT